MCYQHIDNRNAHAMAEAEAPSKPRTVKDRSFARRLNGACEDNAEVPPLNRGRLVWVIRGNLN